MKILHTCHGFTVMICSEEEAVKSKCTLNKTYFSYCNVFYVILTLQWVSAGCCSAMMAHSTCRVEMYMISA